MVLVLLLLFEGRRAIRPLLVSVGAFLAIQGISLAVSPARTARFFSMASALDERGHAAPSSLALLRDIVGSAFRPWVPLVLYLVMAASILGVFGLCFFACARVRHGRKPLGSCFPGLCQLPARHS